jgi:hypothetical protein
MKEDVNFWFRTIPNHGIYPVLLCLNHYEKKEEYEVCAAIIKAIERKNILIPNLNLTTRISDSLIQDVRNVCDEIYSVDADSMFRRYEDYANQIIHTVI